MPTPKKVLIVDDEVTLTKFVSLALSEMGYETVVANSGRDALKAIREKYFDMILLDLNMPEIDGIHVAKVSKECRPETKIIVVTGRKEEYRDQLKTIQVDEVIQKPVMLNELTKRVQGILGATPVLPRPIATSGTPKARILYLDRSDIVFTNLFAPFIKQKNEAKEAQYELSFADDRDKATTLARLSLPHIIFITTEMIAENPGILGEVQAAEQIPLEIVVHGKELYSKSPDELGFDRKKVTAIEGGFYDLDYPKRLEEKAKEICLRYGLVKN